MFEIDKQKFGAFIAQLRKEKGLTQKELAGKLFISDKAVSKWETGASIPDTALLIPLSELLGVSVTELLTCQRMEKDEPISSTSVEQIVKTAIAYSEEGAAVRGSGGRWAAVYVLSVLVGGMGMYLNFIRGAVSGSLIAMMVLGVVFGAYFCFFARNTLPAYYDQNRIGGVHDGVFRMNVPGLYFNNSNWKHIMRVGRIWACAVTAFFPLLVLLGAALIPQVWAQTERYVFLVLSLGGLFVPVYIVGKRFE